MLNNLILIEVLMLSTRMIVKSAIAWVRYPDVKVSLPKVGGEWKSSITSWTLIGLMSKFNHVFVQVAISVRVSACNQIRGLDFKDLVIITCKN